MLDRRIKFRHIQCFVEIAGERSFKRAAEKLYLTQPAISKSVKELEQIIGARLMERSRSGVELTNQGEVFLHFAQMSLATLQQGLAGVEQEGSVARETITIGALPSVAAWLMPMVSTEFAGMAPSAILRIMDGPHAYLVERLRLGELDLVIGRMGRPESMQGVSFTQLYGEEVVVVVRPEHPLVGKSDITREIVDWPVIYPPEGAAIRPLVERWLIANGIGNISNRIETVSGAFGRARTRHSDAIWFISGGVVANDIADGQLVKLPINMSITQGPVGLMTRSDEVLSAMGQVFNLAVKQALSVPDKQWRSAL